MSRGLCLGDAPSYVCWSTMRWLRSPLLHYLLLGGAFFLADRRWLEPARSVSVAPVRSTVVISAAQQRELRESFTRQTGFAPSPDDERALLGREVDTELLYREALALGLERGDRTIRWQLVEKMSFIDGVDDPQVDGEALYRRARALGFDQGDPVIRRMLVEKLRLIVKAGVARAGIDDAALEAHLAAHADHFRQPPRITFRHVFFARGRRGERAEADARAALTLAERANDAAVVARLGDAFPLGSVARAQSPAQIATTFGDAFATAVTAQPLDRWTLVPSALGVHLVRVEGRTPGALPALDAVRGQVLAEVVAERGEIALQQFLTRLRARYAIRVDGTEGHAS